MTKQHVHIIKMGGTIEFIDPAYDEINKNLMKLDTSIDSYLHNLIKPHFNFSSEVVAQKDSRQITTEDRELLVKAIQQTSHANIVVTHGTFTMQETAQFIEQHDFDNKKIIMTGSMVPITGFTVSDAGFNLGYAIASFSSLEPGVFLAMNGGVFSASDVRKNTDLFRFE